MVRDYKNAVMKELRDQLVRYAPKDKKPAQMERAEELFRDIRDDVEYSYHYVCLRITEYQSEIFEDILMEAADVRSDLLSLIEDLSESVDFPGDSVPEKVWTIDELCRRFNVASKTISRWRKTMLCGRKFLFDGKRRVGFLDSSVEWFVRNHQNHIERSSRFSQLTETEKQQFIKKGRELAALGITPAEVARLLAQISGRSPETIRSASCWEMIFCAPSILACAILPRMSWRYSLQSNPMDELNASTDSAVDLENRPPHNFSDMISPSPPTTSPVL